MREHVSNGEMGTRLFGEEREIVKIKARSDFNSLLQILELFSSRVVFSRLVEYLEARLRNRESNY